MAFGITNKDYGDDYGGSQQPKPVKKLALIEDNEDDAFIVRRLAQSIGIKEVVHFLTSAAAVEDLEALRSCDCILLDYGLTDMNGLDCLQILYAQEDFPPVLMLSGNQNDSIVIESLKSGARDYLIKDQISKTSLQRSITNAVLKNNLERRLRARNREARQFASMVSHDLKSPIRVISVLSEQLNDELHSGQADQAECAELSAELHQNINYIRRLVTGLVSFLQEGRHHSTFHPVNLNELVQRVVRAIGCGVDGCSTQIEVDDLPTIKGDKTSLTQIFQNLIDNGLKYNQSKQKRIYVYAQPSATGKIKICIEDNGIGISQNHYDKIFSPLERLHSKDEYEGTGLGLALAKKIMTFHKGKISVHSQEGHGSTFILEFPDEFQKWEQEHSEPKKNELEESRLEKTELEKSKSETNVLTKTKSETNESEQCDSKTGEQLRTA